MYIAIHISSKLQSILMVLMSDAVAQVNKMRSVSGLSRFKKHSLVKVENFRGEPSDLDQIILVA